MKIPEIADLLQVWAEFCWIGRKALTSHALRARAPPLPGGEGLGHRGEWNVKPLSRVRERRGPLRSNGR